MLQPGGVWRPGRLKFPCGMKPKNHSRTETNSMSLNIVSNCSANVDHRNLASTEMEMSSSLAKLSAGTRVLSSKDDAASMAIGSRITAEVSALKQASTNAGQASSMLQIADGAMGTVGDVLTRMKTLAVQGASDNLSSTERSMLDT